MFKATLVKEGLFLKIIMHGWPPYAADKEMYYDTPDFKIKMVSNLEIDVKMGLFFPGRNDNMHTGPLTSTVKFPRGPRMDEWIDAYKKAYITINKVHPVIIDLLDPNPFMMYHLPMETVG